MSAEVVLIVQLIVAGFFAAACLRARAPVAPGVPTRFGDLFYLTGRIERLRRSRWQWFSMVGFMLVLRLQGLLPVSVELMAALAFALFCCLPVRTSPVGGALKR